MKKFILILLLLFSIHFWGLIYIPKDYYNITNTICTLILGISFFRIMQKKGLQFKNAIVLFFIGIFINIISAYVNQGQAPLDTFLSFGETYFFILFYFLLHDLQPSRKFLENVIIIFAILYSLFYIFQVLAYPNLIFYSDMLEDRGTIRLRIEGNGFLLLAYFLLLNRFLLNRRLINLLLPLAFFVILLMGGFRTLTLVVLFLSVLLYIKLVRFSFTDFAILTLLVLLFIGLFQFQGTSNILEGMITSSKSDLKQGSEYIRLVELNYFFNEFPENNSIYILGSGMPGGIGSYSRYMDYIAQQYGYFWVDLGILGFYIIIGIIALLGLLWYTIKAIFIKLKQNNLYLNFYFAYLLIVSFTTMEIYRQGIFAVEAIVLYLIDVAVSEDKFSEK